MNKWDTIWLGFVLGLIFPALFCVAYAYTLHLPQLWAPDMVDMLKPVIGRMLLLSTFTDMAGMFLLYEFNLWKIAKGMVAAIIPYMAVGILLI